MFFMMLIRLTLYLIVFFFVMQLDVYFYLLDVIVTASFMQVLLTTLVSGAELGGVWFPRLTSVEK